MQQQYITYDDQTGDIKGLFTINAAPQEIEHVMSSLTAPHIVPGSFISPLATKSLKVDLTNKTLVPKTT